MWNNSRNIVGFRIFRAGEVEFMVTNWMCGWLLWCEGSYVYIRPLALWVRWFRIDYEWDMKRQSTSYHPLPPPPKKEHKKADKSCDFNIFHTFLRHMYAFLWNSRTNRSSSMSSPSSIPHPPLKATRLISLKWRCVLRQCGVALIVTHRTGGWFKVRND